MFRASTVRHQERFSSRMLQIFWYVVFCLRATLATLPSCITLVRPFFNFSTHLQTPRCGKSPRIVLKALHALLVRKIPHTKNLQHTAWKTLLRTDYWGPKHVEPPMNSIKTLCILFYYIYIARWYTGHTVPSYLLLLSDFNEIWIFSTETVAEIRPLEAGVVPCGRKDGRTDTTKLTAVFSSPSSSNAPNKKVMSGCPSVSVTVSSSPTQLM